MKREGGMGSRALDLCSGTFFARDDDSRSGMIDLEGEAFRCFDFLFLCPPLEPMGSSLTLLSLVFWILICLPILFSP